MSWEKILKEVEGFEIVEVDWQNQTEFIIRLKLIDEEGIYEGYCKLVEDKKGE